MMVPFPLSVAPMMDRTDRHFRFFMRRLTRRTLLYTEMITVPAILSGDRKRLLGYHPDEHPIALQVGGDDPERLAEVARIAEGFGYDEINLNVGCPSSRVQTGRFGACLMKTPERVAAAVAAMKRAVSIKVTVKHRIGVDELDRYEDMRRFVDIVAAEGAERFSVHARKAWLSGLSPKENRTVPPLRYPDVYRLKQERPDLEIEINGGITRVDAVNEHLEQVDAVMIGRAAYDDPYLFAEADRRFYGEDTPVPSRHEVVRALVPYAEQWVVEGGRLHSLTRHILGLFTGQPGARAFRRHLSEHGPRPGASATTLLDALARVPDMRSVSPSAPSAADSLPPPAC
ncbi:MAG: tRNA dihydrouridine(20/20a) synthase DusA [Myxococcota bacterium]